MTAATTSAPRVERETFNGARITATERSDGWRVHVRSEITRQALWNPDRPYTSAAAARAAGRAFVREGFAAVAGALGRRLVP